MPSLFNDISIFNIILIEKAALYLMLDNFHAEGPTYGGTTALQLLEAVYEPAVEEVGDDLLTEF